MRKLGFVLILAGISLIAGSVFLHLKTGSLGRTPDAVVRLERALARPGLLALATLNVRALVDLGLAPEPADDDDGPAAQLAASGIDVRRDVSHATLAMTAHEGGETRAALALFGHFEPSAIESALRDRPDVNVSGGGGGEVLLFTHTDPETCEESGTFAAHLALERVLVAHADEIDALLQRATASDEVDTQVGALRDLTRFQQFRGGQLVSGAVFVPDELPSTDNPFVALAAHGAAQQIEGFRAFFVGASPRMVPPGLMVDALFEGIDAEATAAKAAAWQSALDTGRGALAGKLPTLAALLLALEIRAEGHELHAELRLDEEQIEGLRELPGEVGSSLFGASMQVSSDDAVEEQLDDSPLAFRPLVSQDQLADYDRSVPFANEVDHTAGPLGMRLAAIRLGENGAAAELEIEAFATGVPNLGDRGERVSINVTSIESLGGDEILAVEHCGSDRNDKPAPLTASFGGDVLAGKKTLRIRAGARPDDVGHIAGTATIRLPLRTESVRLPAAPGQVATRAGARVEITDASGGAFSYVLSGSAEKLLHLRALNRAGKPLSGLGSSSMGSLVGSGNSGSARYAGVVHEIEAIFALEEALLEYPFELEGTRPGTDGEFLAPKRDEDEDEDPPAFAGSLDDALARLAGRFATAVERVVDGSHVPLASAQAGPFVVSLEGIWTFGGLMPRIEVRAPEIPGLSDNPTAIELRVAELRMKDGSVQTGDWSELLSMGQGFDRKGFVGSAQLATGAPGSGDDVASLHGAVVIRLPERIGALRFSDAGLGAEVKAPGLSVRITELGRDRFTLRATSGGDRVLGARAYNAFGDELWIPDSRVERREDGSVDLTLQVKGVPEKIDLRYAETLARAEYPFTLTKDSSEIALRSR